MPRRRAKSLVARRIWRSLLLVAAFAAVAVIAALLEPLPPTLGGTVRVSDGDSFHLGDERIRLTGLDAPELDQTCVDADGATWNCGRQSRDRLREIVAGETITCETEGRDRYGRYLARCTVGGEDLGARLVADGFAVASPPSYAAEEALARSNDRGIWSSTFVNPRQWRDTHGDVTAGFDLIGWIRSWFT